MSGQHKEADKLRHLMIKYRYCSSLLSVDLTESATENMESELDFLNHFFGVHTSCTRIVIGNGTACRETESFFADLISKRFFQPLDVSYW